MTRTLTRNCSLPSLDAQGGRFRQRGPVCHRSLDGQRDEVVRGHLCRAEEGRRCTVGLSSCSACASHRLLLHRVSRSYSVTCRAPPPRPATMQRHGHLPGALPLCTCSRITHIQMQCAKPHDLCQMGVTLVVARMCVGRYAYPSRFVLAKSRAH